LQILWVSQIPQILQILPNSWKKKNELTGKFKLLEKRGFKLIERRRKKDFLPPNQPSFID